MSKYRFAGTIKEIKSTTSSKELAFVPDREYAVSEKDEILFVAFLPEDDKEVGMVFKYADNVRIVDKDKAKWAPTWKVNGHYALVLESVTDEKDCDIEIKDAPTSKYFKLESVAEKA